MSIGSFRWKNRYLKNGKNIFMGTHLEIFGLLIQGIKG